MKVLSNENLEALQGGILCSQIEAVLAVVMTQNSRQGMTLLETYSVFGHGGTYTLQCQPG
jgi:hypothetical protein